MEVYHIAPEEFDHGATRDMAARKSTADLMLFMTQDAVPADTHLVEYLAKAFDDPLVAAASENCCVMQIQAFLSFVNTLCLAKLQCFGIVCSLLLI